MEVTPLAAVKVTVLFCPSNSYATPVVKVWVRCIYPSIMPAPVLVVVMVNVLVPVVTLPSVILMVATETLLCTSTTLVPAVLLILIILKVVAPVTVASLGPLNSTVLVPAVNVPLFIQLPFI